jgi:hypothetical protein
MKKIVWILAIILPSVVSAHVVLENQEAVVGSNYKAVLKVSHGCNGQATQKLIVEIPDGFRGAKPMVKSDWKITTVKGQLIKPYISHGKTITDEIIRIEWEGNLPAHYYDEFVLLGQLPESPGNLYFKVTQLCPSDKQEWTQIPEQGKTVKDYSAPAALLKVLPKPEVNHEHQNH